MSILDKANKYIGHPKEVDEGYEVSMRRSAYIAGYQEAVNDIRDKVEALRDNYVRQLEAPNRPALAIRYITGKLNAAEMIVEIIDKHGDNKIQG